MMHRASYRRTDAAKRARKTGNHSSRSQQDREPIWRNIAKIFAYLFDANSLPFTSIMAIFMIYNISMNYNLSTIYNLFIITSIIGRPSLNVHLTSGR